MGKFDYVLLSKSIIKYTFTQVKQLFQTVLINMVVLIAYILFIYVEKFL